MKKAHRAAAILSALMLTASAVPVSCASAETAPITTETQTFYQQWKTKYLKQDTYVQDETQYYVWYSEETYAGDDRSVAVNVSEAHGYGMLIFASMAAYDTQAKSCFDGMYRYYKAHPSDIGSHLMSWQQCDNGTALIDGAEEGSMTGGYCDSATDGDMDIAYALLMADAVWGSDGEINYLADARAMIDDIMTYDVNHEYWTLTLGDWVSECDSSEIYYHATRPSDFIVQYLPVFAEVSEDARWMQVYQTTYQIIEDVTAQSDSGLLPDFVVRQADGTFSAAQADFLESEYDGCYSYNSCRTPWRISMDYLLNGNENARSFAERVTGFITDKTRRDPWSIMAGYDLSGNAIEEYDDLCFTAPFLIAAACTEDTAWHDAVRDAILQYGDDVYYGDTIKLLCLIVDDGGWLVPGSESDPGFVWGDVNADGKFSINDLIAMQRYLLGDGTLLQWQAGDLSTDGTIDVYDLGMMKRLLFRQ